MVFGRVDDADCAPIGFIKAAKECLIKPDVMLLLLLRVGNLIAVAKVAVADRRRDDRRRYNDGVSNAEVGRIADAE